MNFIMMLGSWVFFYFQGFLWIDVWLLCNRKEELFLVFDFFIWEFIDLIYMDF